MIEYIMCVAVVLMSATNAINAKSVESELLDNVLSDYDARALPRHNPHDHVTVNHSLELYKIHDVDEQKQVVSLYFWIYELWEDEFFTWNISQYQNITEVYVDKKFVWRPLTFLERNIEMYDDLFQRLSHSVVRMGTEPGRNYSRVSTYYPSNYQVSCPMDVGGFPWDIHTCILMFYSALYPDHRVQYKFGKQDLFLSRYESHSQWLVINATSNAELVCVSADGECYSALTYKLTFGRKATYYIINLMLPCVVINVLCIVGLFTASSSSDERSEKITMGITAMLSLSVYLLIISDHIPVSSVQIPYMIWFFIANYILLFVSVLATLLLMNFAIQRTRERGMNKFYTILWKLLTCRCWTSSWPQSRNGKSKSPSVEDSVDLAKLRWTELEGKLECILLWVTLFAELLIVVVFLSVGYGNRPNSYLAL